MTLPRVLLVGAGGQVGRALRSRLAGVAQLTAATRRDVDVTDCAAIEAAFRAYRPSLVVNAAAYTAVDAAESDRTPAWRVNAEAPAHLAHAARDAGAAIIHFSTDYIFDGRKRRPYLESDQANPLNEYGRSKLAGDEAIARSGAPHLILRTTWVYDRDGRNFVNAIANRARETGQLRVVADQMGAPTHAATIADTVTAIVQRLSDDTGGLAAAVAERSGLYNLSAAGATSWYDFAREILDAFDIAATVEPITTAEYGAPAVRPLYSLLDNTKLAAMFGVTLPDWRDDFRRRARLVSH